MPTLEAARKQKPAARCGAGDPECSASPGRPARAENHMLDTSTGDSAPAPDSSVVGAMACCVRVVASKLITRFRSGAAARNLITVFLSVNNLADLFYPACAANALDHRASMVPVVFARIEN